MKNKKELILIISLSLLLIYHLISGIVFLIRHPQATNMQQLMHIIDAWKFNKIDKLYGDK